MIGTILKRIPPALLDCLLIAVVSIPAFAVLFTGDYYTMHDDQHIARLYLLHQAIMDGVLYPRWVDMLGFGYGYPLFNFYPPLIYYAGLFFVLLGFSYIWSVKLVIISGFIIAAVGAYLLARYYFGRAAGITSAVLYTFATYHAVVVYVRGALAEFFGFAVLPFLFLALLNMADKKTLRSAAWTAVAFTAVMLTHPLVAFPSVLFIGLFWIYQMVITEQRFRLTWLYVVGFGTALLITAFFWVPSIVEKQFTYVDSVFLGDLADYLIHYICPGQLWSSPWGYGGSAQGCLADGISLQLGKVQILAAIGATIGFTILAILHLRSTGKRFFPLPVAFGLMVSFLTAFSVFMTLQVSRPVWMLIDYLKYLQFPWRFLTFVSLWIAILGGTLPYLVERILRYTNNTSIVKRIKAGVPEKSIVQRITAQVSESKIEWLIRFGFPVLVGVLVSVASIATYTKYFTPQHMIATSDTERTSFDELTWRISYSSFEFVPKGVETVESEFGTPLLAITPETVAQEPFELIGGEADVEVLDLRAHQKEFVIDVSQPVLFRLNTFSFPGWNAYLRPVEEPGIIGTQNAEDGSSDMQKDVRDSNVVSGAEKPLQITDDNALKLITVEVPIGQYELTFRFENTPVRSASEFLTLGGLIVLGFLGWKKPVQKER